VSAHGANHPSQPLHVWGGSVRVWVSFWKTGPTHVRVLAGVRCIMRLRKRKNECAIWGQICCDK